MGGGWGTIVVNDKAEFAISSVLWLDPAFCGWNHAGCVVEMMHAAVPRYEIEPFGIVVGEV